MLYNNYFKIKILDVNLKMSMGYVVFQRVSFFLFQVAHRPNSVKTANSQWSAIPSIPKGFPSLSSTWFLPNPLDGYFKKSNMRESKDFVDMSKNVFETLSVKYGCRFPRGVVTFARRPPGYTQALIECRTPVSVMCYL